MAPCERCGTGTRSGRGKGWCSNLDCREAEKKEKEAAKRLKQEDRAAKRARKRGPCPGEGGRPADSEEVKAEKLEAPGCYPKVFHAFIPKIKERNGKQQCMTANKSKTFKP